MEIMDRRKFLGTMTAATLLSSKLSWSAQGHKIDKIGVQLYTVRDDMKKDMPGTLAKVAQIGYREVEFAGYFNHSPQEVRAMLDQTGLVSPAAHVDYALLGEKWQETLDGAKVIGQSYIVCPMVPDNIRKQPDGWKQVADAFNKAGAVSKKNGLQFAYHNHHFEFVKENGKAPYDILLEETDSNLVKMEMDLCWAVVGGADPVAYFNRYPGRFPLVHVKDMKSIPKPAAGEAYVPFEKLHPQMTDVGSGMIDWKRIFAQADKAGIKHYFVEHDEPQDAYASLRNSYNYLHNLSV
jgi:sugar phosphate isomerase/epimerase